MTLSQDNNLIRHLFYKNIKFPLGFNTMTIKLSYFNLTSFANDLTHIFKLII